MKPRSNRWDDYNRSNHRYEGSSWSENREPYRYSESRNSPPYDSGARRRRDHMLPDDLDGYHLYSRKRDIHPSDYKYEPRYKPRIYNHDYYDTGRPHVPRDHHSSINGKTRSRHYWDDREPQSSYKYSQRNNRSLTSLDRNIQGRKYHSNLRWTPNVEDNDRGSVDESVEPQNSLESPESSESSKPLDRLETGESLDNFHAPDGDLSAVSVPRKKTNQNTIQRTQQEQKQLDVLNNVHTELKQEDSAITVSKEKKRKVLRKVKAEPTIEDAVPTEAKQVVAVKGKRQYNRKVPIVEKSETSDSSLRDGTPTENVELGGENESIESPEPVKRKRGRPPKIKTEPQVTEEPQVNSEPSPTKNSIGRTVKRNAVKSKVSNSSELLTAKKNTRLAEDNFEAELQLAIQMSMQDAPPNFATHKGDEEIPESHLTPVATSVQPPKRVPLKRGPKQKGTSAKRRRVDSKQKVSIPNPRTNIDAIEQYLDWSERCYCGKSLLDGATTPKSTSQFGISNLAPEFGPIFDLLTCKLRQPHILDLWGPKELVTFELGLFRFGKEFYEIQQLIPTKTVKEIVDLYYLWKKTNRYTLWKANRVY
ncbi:bifunctional Homeobox-like domain superfamily/SANT domain/Ubiquitin interacting motif [Babesia duncani]|uniref:Bifunctional Homeobox-like domain superfamily/SANT domain/Ubiquitin interacting motif n=1 Tax=Babesia duncani TaxID=323732 RepID=A0AAD9PLP4_9APIC|nr:bifunctional Homeobox-like domain superfamily/SANT domain/Ubiquitin interacting motif [Babesia duncani]